VAGFGQNLPHIGISKNNPADHSAQVNFIPVILKEPKTDCLGRAGMFRTPSVHIERVLARIPASPVSPVARMIFEKSGLPFTSAQSATIAPMVELF